MPLYTVHVSPWTTNDMKQEAFFKALTALHVQTFGTDPAAVRVEFVIGSVQHTRYRYVSVIRVLDLVLKVQWTQIANFRRGRSRLQTPNGYF